MSYHVVPRMRVPSTVSLTRSLLFVACLAGCGASTRATFHASDPNFRQRPGPAPRAYLEADVDKIPRVPMRSVGIIEVVVPNSSVTARGVQAAIEKGRDLGCWIVVEHSVFVVARSRASLDFGARIYLAHGPAPHISGAPRRSAKIEFDCVVQGDDSRAFRRQRTTYDRHTVGS